MKKRVLFSLFDQKNAVVYAKQLVVLGWEIIASKETYDLLKQNCIPVVDISYFLKIKDKYPFPPTLHPMMELALTTGQGKSIDFVYITNYPLSKGNDVGGNTILALAAKGKRIVVFNRKDMGKVVKTLKSNNNEIPPFFRQQLIDKVYAKIAGHYTSLIHSVADTEIPEIIIGEKFKPLLEGENPYQIPADIFRRSNKDVLSLSSFKQISGDLLCYTNTADFDCILHTMCLLVGAFKKHYRKIPYIAIAAKHGNPTGLAINWNFPSVAIKNALFGNPLAIFGGEVIVNFSINEKLSKMLIEDKKRRRLLGNSKWSLDLVVASDFNQKAVKILSKSQRLKLLKNKNLINPNLSREAWAYRMVRGGFLRQPPNNYVLDLNRSDSELQLPGSNQMDSLIIAWAVAWTSSHGGNEIAIAKNRMLLAAGGGPSTIDACRIAINRSNACGHNLQGSVFAANAFFPFIDAPTELIKAGCVCGLVPKGGRNFGLVKDYFKKHRTIISYLAEGFRGFCRH